MMPPVFESLTYPATPIDKDSMKYERSYSSPEVISAVGKRQVLARAQPASFHPDMLCEEVTYTLAL
jgi:hypothetical protein